MTRSLITLAALLAAACASGSAAAEDQTVASPFVPSGRLAVTLELDKSSYLVGEPITGCLVVRNTDAEPLTITSYLDVLDGHTTLELLVAGHVRAHSVSPLSPPPELLNWLPLAPGASVRVPLCWFRQLGAFVLDQAGDWEIRARGDLFGKRGGHEVREEFATDPLPIHVAPQGGQYDAFAAFFNGLDFLIDPMEMMYPARRAGDLAAFGDYERSMAAVVVYQESLGMKPMCEGKGGGASRTYDPGPDVAAALQVAKRYGIAVGFRLWVARIYEGASGQAILDAADAQAAPAASAYALR